MKEVSVVDLKSGLSAALAEAEAGATILVTRHKRPVAQLGPACPAHVHVGRRVGVGRLEPVLEPGRSGRYLAVLLDDRSGS